MPRRQVFDSRNDFRGGRNTTNSPDILNTNELVDCTNARLSIEIGGVVKRTGSRRIHTTALPAAVMGLVQWDSPSGKQIIAISNGDLYHKTTELGEFTQVDPGPTDAFSLTTPAYFASFRASSSGAPLVLFIASGGKMYKWDGATLTRIDGTTFAPTADLIIAYHTRMFARSNLFLKSVIWSKLGNAEDFTVALGTGGGQAYVDVLNGESLVAFEVIGTSLLMAAEDSIMRFTGHSSDDIIIAQDTEGVSAEIGVIGPLCLKRVENVAFGLAERGPHVITEQTVVPVGVKVEEDFDALDRVNLPKACIGYHRGRREVWYAVPGPADSGLNKTVYVYSTRLQAWSGPFTYSFGITYLSRYEDVNGDEWLIAGCSDGRVRHLDTGVKDDVLSDASGGTNYTMTVELAPFFFNGPNNVKSISRMFLQADLPAASAVQVLHDFDRVGYITTPVQTGSGISSYQVDLHNQGKRLRIKFTDASAEIPIIYGFTLEGWFFERTY